MVLTPSARSSQTWIQINILELTIITPTLSEPIPAEEDGYFGACKFSARITRSEIGNALE